MHASLGYVYELLQDIDRAIDHYEQVCKHDKLNVEGTPFIVFNCMSEF